MVVIELPTLDLGLLSSSEPSELMRMASACEELGMFYLSNHGMSSSLMSETMRTSREFFRHSSPKSLAAIGRSASNFRGYLEKEYTKNMCDWKLGFDFGAQNGSLDEAGMEGVNQWPQNDPHFEMVMRNYFSHMERIARILMRSLSELLQVDPSILEAFFEKHTSMARLNYYPPCPHPDQNRGVHLHTDDGAITILCQDDEVAALQLQSGHHVWDDVPPKADTFTIIVGDLIQVLSNDRFRAPVHHAVVNSRKDRVSIPFFYYPSFQADIRPIDNGRTNNFVAKYKAINWGHFRRTRFQGDHHDLAEEDIQISHFKIN